MIGRELNRLIGSLERDYIHFMWVGCWNPIQLYGDIINSKFAVNRDLI